MANLNVDVAMLVCEQLYLRGAKTDLLNLAEVSVLWNTAVRPWLYRSITLDFEPTKALGTARLIKSLLSADQKSNPSNFVRSLQITMQSLDAGDLRRCRLRKPVLKALTRLVVTLPNLTAFKWWVREPMPEGLLQALDSHKCLAKRTAMLALCGLEEEQVYTENLENWSSITALAVEYCARADVESLRMTELSTYPLYSLLGRPSLKELSISHRHLNNSGFHYLAQGFFGPPLAPVEHLSLDYYQFPISLGTLHDHINISCLRRLTLTDCQDFHRLFQIHSWHAQLKNLTLWRPIYNPRYNDVQYSRLIQFLESQTQLEVIDLEQIGMRHSTTPLPFRGPSLHSIRFHNLEDHVTVTDAGDIVAPTENLKSVNAATLHRIASACPKLTSLSIGLTQLDIKPTSAALKTLASKFHTSLKHLEINTVINTHAIDPSHRQMTNDRITHIASAAWSAHLSTLRIKVDTVVAEPRVMGAPGSWLVTRSPMTRTLLVVDEAATARERKFRTWKRALGPVASNLAKEDGQRWEQILGERMVAAGAKALKGLK